MKKKKSILIVSGGSIDVDFAKEYLRERQYDHIVAADSGLAHCKEIGIEPTDILGDFDSLRNLELLEYYRQKEYRYVNFQHEKIIPIHILQ